jgi:hypothetical protein
VNNLLSFRRKKLSVFITQAFFSPDGGLVVQTFLFNLTRTIETAVKQVTLDPWLKPTEESPLDKDRNKSKCNVSFEDWDDTISCIELEMRHDRDGYLVDWMKGEPRGDNWDGSVDNQEGTLEKHIGKYGWQF